MSTRVRTLAKPARGPEETKTLDLSLPIPTDSHMKVEALEFLNSAVEEYIERYGQEGYNADSATTEDFDSVIRPDIHFPKKGRKRPVDDDDDFIPDHPVKKGLSVAQAIQLGLCAFLIFLLW